MLSLSNSCMSCSSLLALDRRVFFAAPNQSLIWESSQSNTADGSVSSFHGPLDAAQRSYWTADHSIVSSMSTPSLIPKVYSMAGKHRRDVALHSFLLPYLFPRVVWIVYLVGLDAKHYTGCLHGQLYAIRRLPETFNLVERKEVKTWRKACRATREWKGMPWVRRKSCRVQIKDSWAIRVFRTIFLFSYV